MVPQPPVQVPLFHMHWEFELQLPLLPYWPQPSLQLPVSLFHKQLGSLLQPAGLFAYAYGHVKEQLP
jgi:hypothetical protein